jgi:hypothetical protein
MATFLELKLTFQKILKVRPKIIRHHHFLESNLQIGLRVSLELETYQL